MEGAVSSTDTSTVLPASVCGTGAEPGVSMRSPATKAMVYLLQVHLPVFIKRHVLVNFPPRGMRELSGTVTSSSSTALSLHEPLADADAVPPGVVVVDESGVEAVEVGGTSSA